MVAATPPALPPGPKGLPILGNALDLSRETLRFLARCGREYGDLVSLRFLGKPILFVNHPALIEQVLTTRQRAIIKDVAQRTDHALIGRGLFLSEGETWRRQRRLMQPAFHRERIVAYGATMVAKTTRALDDWRADTARDIYDDMSRLTLEIVAQTMFDADLRPDAATIVAALARALDCLDRRVRGPQLFLPERLPTANNLRMRRARRAIDRIVYRIIRERRASGVERDDLLGLLLGGGDDTPALTERQVRDEVMTILVGGYETAADLLAWTWYLLARHPAIEACFQAEIDGVLGGRPPQAADLTRLPYTGMIVSEVLRLYPPAPALGREVTEPFDLGGYRVARGTDVLISQWVAHRDPRYFAEPDRFWPERWADDLARRLPRYAYFPFGGGPRLCIGHAFATMEATLLLATIGQRFRLELPPGPPVAMAMIPTLRPQGGLRMICRAR